MAHQPKAREKVELFIDADVKNEKFTDLILEQYDRNKLRVINLEYPQAFTRTSSTTELFHRCDIMILPEITYKTYIHNYEGVFAEINPYIQEKCQIDSSLVYENCGIRFETTFLSKYVNLTSNDYVLAFLANSKNLGAAFDENNAKYDNALTVAHYLIEGVE